jgi:YD repeat-containing protein
VAPIAPTRRRHTNACQKPACRRDRLNPRRATTAATYTYDAFGRLTARTETDLSSTWLWDAPASGAPIAGTTCKGSLYQSSASGAATIPGGFIHDYAYDSACRAVDTSNAYGGAGAGWITAVTQVDSVGRYYGTSYPDGFATEWTYSTTGYANEIQANPPGSGTGYQVAWTLQSIDAAGNVTESTAGGGMVTNDSYNVRELLNTETIGISGQASIVNTNYNWDTAANGADLLQRIETGSNLGSGVSNVTDNYTYDDLHELSSDQVLQNGTQLYAESFTYMGGSTPDGTYRLYVKQGTGTYTYGNASHPNAPSSISGALTGSATYDADGAATSDFAGRGYGWSSFDMPLTVTENGTTTKLYYDAEHRRVRRVVTTGGATTTTDCNGFYGKPAG